ncbi:MAG: hypothetical protein IH991_25860 [Planctomycetes bacterium]|nr:hypothetical protein [Planctomycetota bacterium]
MRFNNQEEYLEGTVTRVRHLNQHLRKFEQAAQRFQFYLPGPLYQKAMGLVAFFGPTNPEDIRSETIDKWTAELLGFRREVRKAVGVDRLSVDFERNTRARMFQRNGI